MSRKLDDLFTRLHGIEAERPKRNSTQELHRAGIWCASQALTCDGDPATALRDLLYAIGLLADPHALKRLPGSPSKVAAGQRRDS